MNAKAWVIIAFLAISAIKVILQLVQNRSASNPIPENVSDVYDNETYLKWQKYHGELGRLSLIETLVNTAAIALLLFFDVFSLVSGIFGENTFAQLTAVLLFLSVVELVFSLPFSYVSTMKIEEKYGFNRSTLKIFVKDQIVGFILGVVLNFAIVSIMCACHIWLGDGMAVLFSVALCAFVLIVNLVAPAFMRIQNKFTPLPDGELKTKLTDLLTKHGYQVKAIEVMDASRRTSKGNAFFSGFGKQKRIVLFDTLLETMDDDEICAVFAHELGHGLHKDIPKLLIMNCGNMILTALLAWLTVSISEIYSTFGFTSVNYGFAYIVLSIAFLPLVMQLTALIINAVSRKAEYAADAQAFKEGYGDALISGLKKLSRGNFAHLSPSKLLVLLNYNHPPLSERITAIEKLKK